MPLIYSVGGNSCEAPPPAINNTFSSSGVRTSNVKDKNFFYDFDSYQKNVIYIHKNKQKLRNQKNIKVFYIKKTQTNYTFYFHFFCVTKPRKICDFGKKALVIFFIVITTELRKSFVNKGVG